MDEPVPGQGRGPDPGQRLLVRRSSRGVVPSPLPHRRRRTRSSRALPALAPHRDAIAGRAMLVPPHRRRCRSSAWCAATCPGRRGRSTGSTGTLAGEPLPAGLVESDRLDPPLFSPATKAETGHDENVTFAHDGARRSAPTLARRAPRRSASRIYEAGRDHAAARGIIIADTKFEFGHDADGTLLLIDEVLTPDSSRFWPADRYAAGPRASRASTSSRCATTSPACRQAGRWNGEAPPPPLPARGGRRHQRPLPATRTGCSPAAPLGGRADAHRTRGVAVHRRRLLASWRWLCAVLRLPAGRCVALAAACADLGRGVLPRPGARRARAATTWSSRPPTARWSASREVDEPTFIGGEAHARLASS